LYHESSMSGTAVRDPANAYISENTWLSRVHNTYIPASDGRTTWRCTERDTTVRQLLQVLRQFQHCSVLQCCHQHCSVLQCCHQHCCAGLKRNSSPQCTNARTLLSTAANVLALNIACARWCLLLLNISLTARSSMNQTL
jgi:hypothetical protein